MQGSGLCDALGNSGASWLAIRDYIQTKDQAIFDDLISVEHVDGDQKLSRIRLARQAGGFAFDYWAHGGDLNDIESLVNCFDTILGQNELPRPRSSSEEGWSSEKQRDSRNSVVLQIQENAKRVSVSREPGAWTMPLQDRLNAITRWEAELEPSSIVDQLIEVHRRYQSALLRIERAREEMDIPLLEIREMRPNNLH